MHASRLAPIRLFTVFSVVMVLTATLLVGFSTPPTISKASAAVSNATANRAADIARGRAGSAYQYGANGPYRFDCSGLAQWVYGRVGKSLPRTSSQQSRAVHRVSRASSRRGDLVFFYGGGGVYHVGIRAKRGYVWHAPNSGERVKRSKIWTNKVFVGRVG